MLIACIVLVLAVPVGTAPSLAQGDPTANAIAKIEKRYGELYAAGKYAAALTQARKLAAMTKTRLGERHPQYVTALEKLNLTYAALGRDERAVAVAEQVMEIVRSRNGTVGTDLADMLVRLATRYDLSGRHHEAASAYSNMLTIKLELLKRQPKANELKIATVATELAAALTDDGDLAQAIELHTFALAIRERKLSANDLLVAENLHGLAALAAKQDRREEAERLYRSVIAIREAKLGPTHGDVADVLEELAEILGEDRNAEGEPLRERAQIIRRTDRPSFVRGLMRPGLRLVPPPALAPRRPSSGLTSRPF
jgi:tetratricopeptide (TPR) repeat protein